MEGCVVNHTTVATNAQPGQKTWPEALLFDLDGTLIDSVPDLAAATNELLAQDNLSPLSVDAVRGMIGNGVMKARRLRAYAAMCGPVEGEALAVATDRMMAIYGRHLTGQTALMPGAMEMVTAYHKAGVRIAVVTNKPEAFTHELIKHFGFDGIVDVVVGGDTGPQRKPAPDMLEHALAAMGVASDKAIMVGDSPADIDSAKAARIL
jgi:phosphoglycolate phosphatase